MLLHSLRALSATPTSRAIALVFIANGFVLANWFTRIPATKEALGLGDGALGLALMGMPLGSALILPFSGRLVGRFGAGTLAAITGLATATAAALPAFAVDIWSLAFAMFLLGFANGAMDVSMNAKGAAIERALGFNIMSALHGMYGVGVLLGSTAGSLFAGLAIPVAVHLPLTSALAIAALLAIRAALADRPAEASGPGEKMFAFPHGPLWPLACIAVAAFLAEGAAADWSAVYVRTVLDAPPGIAALALAGFSLGLTLTRFIADSLGERFGELTLLRGGSALAGIGMTAGLLQSGTAIAILGFVALGAGLAAVVPIAFRRASNTPGIPPGTGVAAVATVGYTGFLAGPPLIGLLAEAIGLRAALFIIPILAIGIATLGVASIRRS
ncbi:MAG: MFS transporter [Geminicoccaceae bacterium]|jgi:MFS family permease|nr:MFS transporter [Geminicoccaceae bacterium]MCB9968036.1 MFS transporter [Geminicoccaceae bacterium]HRY24250.1 MFS transporter [Geminicoccaceae bacterium]